MADILLAFFVLGIFILVVVLIIENLKQSKRK